MEYLIGALLAAGVASFGHFVGLDRERSFYTTVLMVVASYYILFAAMAESHHALHVEIIGFLAFAVIAVVGYKRDMRIIAAGLVGHGLFDFFLHRYVNNPGVPVWWPGFCMAFDVAIGLWVFVDYRRAPEPKLD